MMASLVYASQASVQQPAVDATVATLAEQLSKLRADIVAGNHARFKVPPHLAHNVKPAVDEAGAQTTSVLSNGAQPQAPGLSFQNGNIHQAPTGPSSNMRAIASSNHAEQFLRQRRKELERMLEEQVHQKKAASRRKTCDQEIVADFDVAEVLRKAQELVPPWKPHDASSANHDASSDSFDENTYYSSQMNESTTTEEVEVPKPNKRPMRVCRFFRDKKPCPYGEKCTFSHDPSILKKVEAEEQQRANGAQPRANEQPNKRVPTPPRKVSKAKNAQTDIPIVQDAAAARIAELEEKLRQMTEKQEKAEKQEKQAKRSKPTVVPRAIERPDPDPQQPLDEFVREPARWGAPRDVCYDPSGSFAAVVNVSSSRVQQPMRVAQNHITSPYAPQPANVSPLVAAKPAQVSRLQRAYIDDSGVSNGYQTDGSTAQSPAPQQPLARHKRRRPAEDDRLRNVAQRTENVLSPGIRIKEEPVSPPPFFPATQAPQVQDFAPYANKNAIVPSQDGIDRDGAYVFRHPVQEMRPETPSRRAVNGIGSQQVVHEDIDLRRAVSTRHIPPLSPAHEQSFIQPQRRMTRAVSQIHYLGPAEQAPPLTYRASVQPTVRERQPQPRQIDLTSEHPTPVPMAPPTRRIVYIDEPAYEAAPVSRRRSYETQYEQVSADGNIVRRAGPPMYDGRGHYVEEVMAPTSPRYIEYASAPRPRQVIRLDDDTEQESYREPQRLVRQPPPSGLYEDLVSSQHQPGVERLPLAPERQAEPSREQISRVQSARPQPRLVRLGEHEATSPRVVRQVSMRAEDYGRPVQDEGMYEYEPRNPQPYMHASNPSAMYEQPPHSAGARKIVRI